jgi:hypothetical protein
MFRFRSAIKLRRIPVGSSNDKNAFLHLIIMIGAVVLENASATVMSEALVPLRKHLLGKYLYHEKSQI